MKIIMVIEDVKNKKETKKGLTFAVETKQFGTVTTVGEVPEDSLLWKEVSSILKFAVKAKKESVKKDLASKRKKNVKKLDKIKK